jgi:hypothetical protein
VKSRIVASAVVALAIAGVAVPAALSGSASASTAPPTITACSPVPATIGQKVTIKGKHLAKAKSVTVGGTKVAKFNDAALAISFTVAKGTSTKAAGVTVKVTTANGFASAKCTFAAAP